MCTCDLAVCACVRARACVCVRAFVHACGLRVRKYARVFGCRVYVNSATHTCVNCMRMRVFEPIGVTGIII